MPNSVQPKITPEHHERYKQIMQVNSNPNAAIPSLKEKPTASKMSAILASLPKPKGIGDKMFIFTGKKKIVLDPSGGKEVEKVKTVDAVGKNLPKEEIKKTTSQDTKTPKEPSTTQTKENIQKNNVVEVKKNKQKDVKKQFPPQLTASIVGLVIILWTLFWLIFLGYIKF